MFGASQASATAADDWAAAQSENTVSAYTAFLLLHSGSQFADSAFCQLQGLDEGAASSAAQVARAGNSEYSVDFTTCASTGAARIYNI